MGIKIFLSYLFYLLFFISLSWSAVTNYEDKHLISIGAGVSHPSAMTAHGSNPAGLIFNHSLKLSTFLSSDQIKFNSPQLGSSLLVGNHSSALVLSISQLKPHISNRRQNLNASGNLYAMIGSALYVKPMDLAIGVGIVHTLGGVRAPFSSIKNKPMPKNIGLGMDAGLLFSPMSSFRTGLSFYQLLDELDHMALGFALDLNDSFTLSLDNSYGLKSNAWTLMPGFAISEGFFKFSIAYGLPIQNRGTSWFSEKAWLGTIAMNFSRNFILSLSYNTHGKYSAEFTVRSF